MDDLLLAWFAVTERDLPWRRTRDPYAILVSEVMLQQTQVERVVPRYLAWLERWPTVEALAAAAIPDVLARVAGARLQPARAEPASRRGGDQRARVAGRPDRAARRRRVHRRGDPQLRVRRRRAAGRHERAPRAGADRTSLRRAQRAGADGSRRDRLPRARPALRDLPARRRLPVARPPLRAASQAVALRGLVPPAARTGAARRSSPASSRTTTRPSPRSRATGSSRRRR